MNYAKLIQMSNKYDKRYIYGAGKIGQNILQKMLDSGIEVEGFLVSDDKFDENKEKTLLRPLYRLAEIVDQNDALVIVALNSKGYRYAKCCISE